MSAPASSTAFYPTVWHAIAALVVQLTGVGVVVAANASQSSASLIWPVAAVFLVSAVFGARPLSLAFGGALSAAFAAFLQRSSGSACCTRICWRWPCSRSLSGPSSRVAPDERNGFPTQRFGDLTRFRVLVCLAPPVGGMSLAHPNSLFSLFVLSAPLLVACGSGSSAATDGHRLASSRSRPHGRVRPGGGPLDQFRYER